jgi:flavodoxin
MNTLIVYYSYSGNNEALAKELQKRLTCDMQQIKEVKIRKGLTILLDLIFNRRSNIKKLDVQMNQYERFILIAPIWGGKIATPMKSFIEAEKKNLKKYSFITVCSGVAGQDKKIKEQLLLLAGKEPENIAELKVRDLLPLEKKGKVKYETPYRIQKNDLMAFDNAIEGFIKSL